MTRDELITYLLKCEFIENAVEVRKDQVICIISENIIERNYLEELIMNIEYDFHLEGNQITFRVKNDEKF